jgi:hypothetical protein
MIGILIWLLIVGVIIGLVYYVADALPIPQPMNKIIKVAAMVVGCIIVIMMLMQLAGVGGVSLPKIVD